LEQRVAERSAELAKKNAELERLDQVFVDRKLPMIELKEKIKEIEEKHNLESRSQNKSVVRSIYF